MGKFSTSKDNFFIGKRKKFSEHSTVRQKLKRPCLTNTQEATTSSSGSFFIKPTEEHEKSESKVDGLSNRKPGVFVKSSTKFQKINAKKTGKYTNVLDSETPENLQRSIDNKTNKPKKLFDKKKWRLQQYSKKYKLEQWEERRKKNLLHEYHKQVEDQPRFDVQKVYDKFASNEEDNDSIGSLNSNSDNTVTESNSYTPKKMKTRKSAQHEFLSKQEEREHKKSEIARKKAEKEQAIKAYKQKKLDKFKKLNKKTKKGQPIMKYRMEMLLEQIQNSVNN